MGMSNRHAYYYTAECDYCPNGVYLNLMGDLSVPWTRKEQERAARKEGYRIRKGQWACPKCVQMMAQERELYGT